MELKVPPILQLVIHAVLMAWLSSLFPEPAISLPFQRQLAVGFAFIGLAVIGRGVADFRIADTTVDPRNPRATSALVISGIYRYTRNPMYVGMLMVLVAWWLYLQNLASGLFLFLFVLSINRYQIIPEERALLAKFGAEYQSYLEEVPRWLVSTRESKAAAS